MEVENKEMKVGLMIFLFLRNIMEKKEKISLTLRSVRVALCWFGI
jgi:hypothetical protein